MLNAVMPIAAILNDTMLNAAMLNAAMLNSKCFNAECCETLLEPYRNDIFCQTCKQSLLKSQRQVWGAKVHA